MAWSLLAVKVAEAFFGQLLFIKLFIEILLDIWASNMHTQLSMPSFIFDRSLNVLNWHLEELLSLTERIILIPILRHLWNTLIFHSVEEVFRLRHYSILRLALRWSLAVD